jgi:hypothetical protein
VTKSVLDMRAIVRKHPRVARAFETASTHVVSWKMSAKATARDAKVMHRTKAKEFTSI